MLPRCLDVWDTLGLITSNICMKFCCICSKLFNKVHNFIWYKVWFSITCFKDLVVIFEVKKILFCAFLLLCITHGRSLNQGLLNDIYKQKKVILVSYPSNVYINILFD